MGLSALITGGASGMGAALAAKLASRGIGLFIADLQTSQGLSVAKSISEEYKVPVDFHQVDITQEKEVKRMVETATRRTGRLDYAANCAGICEKIWAEEESITTDMFDKTYTINQRGLWLCQKYEALQMKTQEPRAIKFLPASRFPVRPQRGAIVNIASISGLHGAGLAAYTPTKFAAVGITKNGAKFYGPDGIRVNALLPGWTFTPMVEFSMGKEGVEGSQESDESSVAQQIALRRMGFAQEQANIMSFLLSDESSYMNGALVVSDGGFHDIR